jgi:hypothetical protein
MANQKNKILVIGSVLALAGVAFYLFRKKKVTEGAAPAAPSPDAPAPESKTETPQAQPQKQSPKKSAPVSDVPPTGVVKAFQDWMDINHPNWVNGKNLNKGSGYGNFGPSTKAAWAKYAMAFRQGKPTYVPTMLGSNYENAINLLVSKGFAANSLRSMPQGFVQAWAEAFLRSKGRFLYNGVYYDTARGFKSENQQADFQSQPF